MPFEPPKKLTPMMLQYLEIKQKHQDCILFYRLGDFYEMFFEDAVTASSILKITLTSRSRKDEEKIPMCGIPFHSADRYIEKLLEAGKKIAICEQVSDPNLSKGIVERKVVQIITPALTLHSTKQEEQNHLASISVEKKEKQDSFVLSYLDLATGQLRSTHLSSEENLRDELSRISAKELLWPKRFQENPTLRVIQKLYPNLLINFLPETAYRPQGIFSDHLVQKIKPELWPAVHALFYYLKTAHFENVLHFQNVEVYETKNCMHLDATTLRNLEILKTNYDGKFEGSLLWLLDQTKTSMGHRKLRQWVLYPLIQVQDILDRQNVIESLTQSPTLLEDIRKALSEVSDLERILSRLTLASANARDLLALGASLKKVPELNVFFEKLTGHYFKTRFFPFHDLTGLLDRAIQENPPLALKEGALIQKGYDAQLDELIHLCENGKSALLNLEAQERQKTGISSLKVRYNQVFGYYIEVTNVHLKSVPSHYIRKQTLVNAERFITEELKEFETRILSATEKRKKLEYEIFENIRSQILEKLAPLLSLASKLSELDAFCALSKVALAYRYTKPDVSYRYYFDLQEARHPVIERTLKERFIPNDIHLDENHFLMVITGPNMAGKSTVMRELALISLLAQIGSFVPASKAELGIVDRIFTRVGAHDNLSQGESTFMVEMKETAHILKHATSQSLIILDEIGRGTSTFDGVSIAWAVANYIQSQIKAKTLFATHYHELTFLEKELKGVTNFHIAVQEVGQEIVFLRKLLPGTIQRSYGVEVARLAGLPQSVITSAKTMLKNLEHKSLKHMHPGQKGVRPPSTYEEKALHNQNLLFEFKGV